jgi:hypothetical protein
VQQSTCGRRDNAILHVPYTKRDRSHSFEFKRCTIRMSLLPAFFFVGGSSVCFLEALVSNSQGILPISRKWPIYGTTIHAEGITVMSSPDHEMNSRAA